MNQLQKIFLIIFLITGFPVIVMAEGHDQSANFFKTVSRQAEISQREAISIAQRRINGRVLDVRRDNGIYRVKILSDQGAIHVVRVSVVDGKIKTGH